MSTTQQRINALFLPLYMQSLLANLCEHNGFDILHASRQLDGIDSETLARKFEMLAVNDAGSGHCIDSVRIVLRDSAGITLTFTWGVFEDDQSSADADGFAKSSFEHDVRFSGAPSITPVLTALATAGFEGCTPQPLEGQTIQFIRGQKFAGKMRLGIHAALKG